MMSNRPKSLSATPSATALLVKRAQWFWYHKDIRGEREAKAALLQKQERTANTTSNQMLEKIRAEKPPNEFLGSK